jgi:hypothetical protein
MDRAGWSQSNPYNREKVTIHKYDDDDDDDDPLTCSFYQ